MVSNIDRGTLLTMMEAGALILDVLPKPEYDSGHIPGAINVPLRQLDADTVAGFQRDIPVVVY